MVEIDDQLPENGAGVRDLAGDLGALLDHAGKSVRALDRHAALRCQ
jgi:hypothetical protein